MTRQTFEEFCTVCGGAVLGPTEQQAWHLLRQNVAPRGLGLYGA